MRLCGDPWVYQERRDQKPYNRQADRRRMPVCNGGGFNRPRVAPRHARRGDGGAPSCHGQCRSIGWTTLHHQHRRQRGARCDGGRRRARVDRSDAQRRVACGRRGVCGQRRGACSMCCRGCRQRDRCRQRGDSQFDRTGNLCRQSGILFSFRVACAFHLRESFSLHKIVAYLGERQHLVFAEFRKKHLATIAENACKHTYLS
jgi:hypothetical protein